MKFFHIEKIKNKILLGDSLNLLKKIPNCSIDIVITDPPYFLDKMDNNWNIETVNKKTKTGIVKSLPPGMKFNKEKGYELYKWFFDVSVEIERILKPGGFFFSFSSPRLYHKIASAIEDAGFLIRDCFIWIYVQNQPKCMSLNHLINKLDIPDNEKNLLKIKLEGWKTPQIKSCFEPIIMSQKKLEENFLKNMIKYNVGLVNTNIKIGENKFPSNIITNIENKDPLFDKYFLVKKPNIKEKLSFNFHKTVKPISIIKYLIELTTFNSDSIVLDPFIGSGTTAIASILSNRNFIGFEINYEYIKIAEKRIKYFYSFIQKLI